MPTYVQSNPDAQIAQLQSILNEFNEDLATRKAAQQNTQEITFVSIAGEDQGFIDTICPLGFAGIILETVFDRTQRLPLYGGLRASEWQARKAFNITGPQYQFRLRNNKLLFSPELPVNHTIAFEYASTFFTADAVTPGVPLKAYWVLDTDTPVFADRLALAYMSWAWPMKKGFEYAEQFAIYERLIDTFLNRDNAPTRVDMGDNCNDLRPGVWVPAGSWLQP